MKYRILSLDGGGSWAILQAMALKEIYKEKPQGEICKEILNDFDLVVANSGGSLALAAMLEKETISEVIEMFDTPEVRQEVFNRLRKKEKTWLERLLIKFGVGGPKYNTDRKISGLQKVLPNFGDKPLREVASLKGINSKILIMGFDYDRKRATYFRSFESLNSSTSKEDFKRIDIADQLTLAEAVHASSNAPVNYFQKPAKFKYQDFERRFWDGAVGGNNNPCLVGLVEAIGIAAKPEDIELRSLGSGSVSLPVAGQTPYHNSEYPYLMLQPKRQSVKLDINLMAKAILQEPPDAATYIAHRILGGRPENGSEAKLVRLNPLIQPALDKQNRIWKLPKSFSPESFKKLVNLDMDAVSQTDVDLIKYLGQQWIDGNANNQPIRMNSIELTCQIGQNTFDKGKEIW